MARWLPICGCHVLQRHFPQKEQTMILAGLYSSVDAEVVSSMEPEPSEFCIAGSVAASSRAAAGVTGSSRRVSSTHFFRASVIWRALGHTRTPFYLVKIKPGRIAALQLIIIVCTKNFLWCLRVLNMVIFVAHTVSDSLPVSDSCSVGSYVITRTRE